jgi:hypothetical protein
MTTYKLVQIANNAGAINPLTAGLLIALTIAFVATAVVIMVKMW